MANLLLKKDKDLLKKEYTNRFFQVLMIFFIFLIIIAGVSLLPSILSVSVKFNALVAEEEVLNSDDVLANKDRLKDIDIEIKEIISFIDFEQEQMSELIQMISRYEVGLVDIQNFEINLVDGEEEIKIRGFAQDRQSLVAFTRRIEAEELFGLVDVPVSSFTKDEDLPFLMTISFNEEENDE
jgi:hypothetical protein